MITRIASSQKMYRCKYVTSDGDGVSLGLTLHNKVRCLVRLERRTIVIVIIIVPVGQTDLHKCTNLSFSSPE